MQLSLGLSPCPNDTFIFDALIHQKVDTEGLTFEIVFEDVETLNQKAFHSHLDITKLSFYAYTQVFDNYILLRSGSALGFGLGPLLISKTDLSLSNLQAQPDLRVGIPGHYTTANFLLSTFAPQLQNKSPILFSTIEEALLADEIDVGLIIHESRFTYQNKGLKKLIDLGEYWEHLNNCAIPLGGIVIKRHFPEAIKQKVNRVIRRSIEFAFKYPKSGLEFIRSHAQSMNEEVMYKHINLYVNNYSIDLGKEGCKAVSTFFDQAIQLNLISIPTKEIFLEELA